MKGRGGWILWGVYALALSIVVALTPHRHTITAYREAAENWLAHRDLYDLTSIHGFLYLPQSALAFVPQVWLPYGLGEVGWRLIGLALMASAIWAFARTLPPRQGMTWFLLLSLAVLPGSFSSARNGQTNFHLAAIFLWIALCLTNKRWNWATALLIVALVLKPVALVPVLLIGALYAPMRLRIAGGLAVFLALPFLDTDWSYVTRQYHLCWEKLAIAREPMEHGFCDFGGMIWTFTGAPLPSSMVSLVGIGMAVVVLALSIRAWCVDRPAAAYWVIALAAAYLMLFNPRTETNSYIILGAAALPFLADALPRRNRLEIALLVALLIAMGCDSYGKPIHPWTHLWLKALAACGFLIWLAIRLLRKSKHSRLMWLP